MVRGVSLGLLLAAGCGSDGGDKKTKEDGPADVPLSKKLGELTKQEAKALCNWDSEVELDAELAAMANACVWFSDALEAESTADCEREVKVCEQESEGVDRAEYKAELEKEYAEDCEKSDQWRSQELADCEATVEEYVACVRDAIKSEVEFGLSLTCDDIDSDREMPEVKSCTEVHEKCPGLGLEED